MENQTDKLIQYIDGQLSAAEAVQIEARLKQDKAYQAEHTALKRVDQLLLDAPMVAPSPNFTARFEARLAQRVRRRRNLIGVSIISLVVALSAGLLVWSFADSGSTLLSLVNGVNLLGYALDLLQSVFAGVGVVFRVVTLMSGTMFQLVKHPVFWGFLFLVVGLVSLWAQLLRRVGFVRSSLAA